MNGSRDERSMKSSANGILDSTTGIESATTINKSGSDPGIMLSSLNITSLYHIGVQLWSLRASANGIEVVVSKSDKSQWFHSISCPKIVKP